MMNRFRNDRPAFVIGHSMGCLINQTFIIQNPNINVAGVIHSAPFFRMPKHLGWGIFWQTKAKIGGMLTEMICVNPKNEQQWMSHDKFY
jgi:alpha-beta hydrolase superfamily lysophospholipase